MTYFKIPPTRHQDEVLSILFHDSAQKKAVDILESFSEILVLQSKIEAQKDESPVVVDKHVEQALNSILKNTRKIRKSDYLKNIGSAFIGAGLSGTINQSFNLTSFTTLLSSIENNIGISLLLIGFLFVGIVMFLLGVILEN
jgi:hypothetical protein